MKTSSTFEEKKSLAKVAMGKATMLALIPGAVLYSSSAKRAQSNTSISSLSHVKIWKRGN